MGYKTKQFSSTCVFISDQAIQTIFQESSGKFPSETGGILVGKWIDQEIIIEHATKPGPNAYHSSHSFKRDGDYSQSILNELVLTSNGNDDYIGEWHSHPINSKPSKVDLNALVWISKNKDYAVDKPLMCLCKNIGINQWELEFYILNNKKLYQVYRCDV